jgi:hypothetical protein
MSALGHSRPGRADSESGHVRYAPIATKFCILPKSRDGSGHRVGVPTGCEVRTSQTFILRRAIVRNYPVRVTPSGGADGDQHR